MRLRKKPNLDKRMERCSHLLAGDPISLRGHWLDEYKYETLCVELGCGMGRFTVETAKAEQGVFFVAIEKIADAMIVALERALDGEITNARFINADADNLADYFAPDEISRIYINFCDPWPTNRHAKRRLTNPRFLEIYSQILCSGGELQFKTDNIPLFDYSVREFERAGLILAETVRDLHKEAPTGIMTDYESKFHSRGVPICFARAVRK